MLTTTLTGCGSNILGALLPNDGTNVAANAQFGKTNTQQVVASQTNADTIDNSRVSAERVETVTINETIPIWVWIGWAATFLIAWELPRSTDIGRYIRNLWRR